MASINIIAQNIDKTQSDIQNIKTKVSNVVGKLHSIKLAISSIDSGSKAGVNVSFVKTELDKCKGNIQKFKELLKEAASTAAVNQDQGLSALKKRQMNDDKTRTLFERLGGDLNIEASVELLYSKGLQDSRTRSFFEKNSRKMQQIRKRMHQFICTITGGPKQYDVENLKPAHYRLNITDYHFDAALEMLQKALVELGCHPDAIVDGINAISKYRKDITTGCTVRMELARRNTEKGRDLLYKKINGDEGVIILMDKLYELLGVDTRIKKYFSKDMKKIKGWTKSIFHRTFWWSQNI